MKTLITANFKAIRTGEFVKADTDAKEFIFDSDNCEDITVATLGEIAKANDITLKKEKRAKMADALTAAIAEMDLPEANERPVSDIVAEIVANGVEAGDDDDDMLMAIVNAGVKFKQAGKMFDKAMLAGGYRVSARERKASVREILVSAEFEPETFDHVQAMIDRILEEVNDTTTSQAMSCIRAFGKEFELEIPKPEKRAPGGFKAKVQDAVLANPLGFSQADLTALCEENKKEAEGVIKRMWPNIEWCQKVAQAAIEAA